jgi:inorganic pyrophosphatase
MEMSKGIQGLRAFNNDGNRVNVVVEVPSGSRAKYKFVPKTGVFELHKALALGFTFPFPFGFIPETTAEDGDPIDVLVITNLDPPLGAVLPARLVGVIKVKQEDPGKDAVRNDRILAVPDVDHEDRPIVDIDDLEDEQLKDIETFFIASGERDGKKLKIVGRSGAAAAMKLLKAGCNNKG